MYNINIKYKEMNLNPFIKNEKANIQKGRQGYNFNVNRKIKKTKYNQSEQGGLRIVL
ncbi:hypothetical protein SDC9_89635 [bioreactor metagenome]|uniref:Uncharacterized protein n=1 Tax=bioreactor metagenome TaxID=1076179 RepID=A0A644ZWE8_9ZZZZ